MSALAEPPEDQPQDATQHRRVTFWERGLLNGVQACRLCGKNMFDWVDIRAVVWRMCVRCDIDVKQPPEHAPAG